METSAAAAPPLPTPEAAEEMQELAEAAEARATEHAEVVFAAELEREPEPLEPLEPLEPAEPAEPAEPVSAAAVRLGPDGLSRLRSRYRDLKSALDEKNDLEPDAKAELAETLERLNPDGWRTPDDVTDALEQYESIFERVRSVVGRHPRRRV